MSFKLSSFLILLQLLPCVFAQNNGTVSVGHKLVAGDSAAPWLSQSGEFAFGFSKLENDLFLLAIWYENIPEKTIIWHANGDNPAPKDSKLELYDKRGLVLSSPQGTELWSTEFASSTVSKGVMNDTGNFQILDQNSENLWNSFGHPTDTLVPTQIMEVGDGLSSRQSETNFSRGRFQFRMLQDGNAVLNPINLATNYTYDAYYTSGTYDPSNRSNSGYQVVFDESGLYMVRRNGERAYITNREDLRPADEYYSRATINYDGVFTVSYMPKASTTNQSWTVAKALPDNICMKLTGEIGNGACGFNSICTITDQRPICNCPEGYSPLDSTDKYGSCKPDFQLSCEESGQRAQEDLYFMRELPNTDWPSSDYEKYSPYNLGDCKTACLQDCLCAVSIFRDGDCWKKKLPLSNGRRDKDVGGTAFVKLMKNDVTLGGPQTPFPNGTKDQNQNALITVIAVLLGSSVFVNLMLVGAICIGFFFYYKKKIDANKIVADSNLRGFTYRELVQATNNFKDELGRGSCGIVYKGTTEFTAIAVKKLDKVLKDSDKEFKTEVNVIGKTHHKNLVHLIGYCDEAQHRILVYEFLSNGTLASFLFGESKPNWNHRVHIALGVARGLVYLHEECSTQIIHCDIKPQNILLDEYYNARISDFGLAKLLMMNQSRTETGIRGTKGYVAPDWFRSAPISAKVDAYSFGVLLLEIICCRKNVDMEAGCEEKTILTDWAYDCYSSRRLDLLIENDDAAVNDMRLERFVMIAIWCLQEDPSVRPTMKKVILMLEGLAPVTIPPSPCPFSSISCN